MRLPQCFLAFFLWTLAATPRPNLLVLLLGSLTWIPLLGPFLSHVYGPAIDETTWPSGAHPYGLSISLSLSLGSLCLSSVYNCIVTPPIQPPGDSNSNCILGVSLRTLCLFAVYGLAVNTRPGGLVRIPMSSLSSFSWDPCSNDSHGPASTPRANLLVLLLESPSWVPLLGPCLCPLHGPAANQADPVFCFTLVRPLSLSLCLLGPSAYSPSILALQLRDPASSCFYLNLSLGRLSWDPLSTHSFWRCKSKTGLSHAPTWVRASLVTLSLMTLSGPAATPQPNLLVLLLGSRSWVPLLGPCLRPLYDPTVNLAGPAFRCASLRSLSLGSLCLHHVL